MILQVVLFCRKVYKAEKEGPFETETTKEEVSLTPSFGGLYSSTQNVFYIGE